MLTKIGDLLLAQWLWSITFDWYHIVLNMIVFGGILMFVLNKSMMRASLASLGTQLFSFFTYTALVAGIMVYVLNWQYTPPEVPDFSSKDYILQACLFLGVIYSIIQTSLFSIARIFKPFRFAKVVAATWVSNIFVAFISYWLIAFASSYHL